MIVTFFTRCLLLTLLLTISSVVKAEQVQMSLRPHPVDLKASLNRILDVSVDKSEEVARSTSLLESLARTLNGLQPSFIMGFSHLANETPLSTPQVALFLGMRQKILTINPRCKFAVTLSVRNYLTPVEFVNKLQEITTKLNPDAINMTISSNNDVVSLSALSRGIEFAHAHGQLVFYEGPANMIPDGIDGFVMKAANGEIHRDEINNFKTKHHLPIIVQFSTAAHGHDQKEILLLSHLAEQQAAFGYHLAYPLQFDFSGNMNTNKESPFLVMLRALVTRYN